jgi:16S rRNA (cytosine1402-N4)-methyltransferase
VHEKQAENLHLPVLLSETMEYLAPERGGVFIDATLGLGGHSEEILTASEETSLIGIDQDTEALAHARKRLEKFGERFKGFHSNFESIKEVWETAGKPAVKGILADLGVSSLQFDSAERGFSFRFDAPLDMRMDAGSDIETAAELLERLPEEEIANIIYQYGEEKFSRRIARWIVEQRDAGTPIKTTKELADLVYRAVKTNKRDTIHPATRTFQALRIAVNGELDVLTDFISDAVDILSTGGRLAIISFHSLEDRIVKQAFLKLSGRCSCPPRMPQCICGAEKKVEILTKRPVIATEAEMSENPRSRSAKMRVCGKL